MTFGDALTQLKAGASVRRTGWTEPGMMLVLMPAGEFAASFRMVRKHGAREPWSAKSGTVPESDILADDWELVEA